MKKKTNYIDNEEFFAELCKWRDSHRDPDQRVPSERLGEMLITLSDHMLKHEAFRGYRQDIKEEMKSFNLYRILKCGLKSFKFDKKNAFGYFTNATYRNYIQVLGRYYTKLNHHQNWLKNELARIDTYGNARLEEMLHSFGVYGNEEELKTYYKSTNGDEND